MTLEDLKDPKVLGNFIQYLVLKSDSETIKIYGKSL